MEQTTLKYLRVFVPGLTFYLGVFPIARFYFGDSYDIASLDFAYVTVFSLLAGAIYYQVNVQSFMIRPSRRLIGKNILDKLLGIYGKPVDSSQKDFLKEKYMYVFYRTVDGDETLKKKANIVYFNGIFWTSSVDVLLLSLMFWVMYRWVFTQVEDAPLFSDLFLTLAALSAVLHVFSVRKHIALSNDQLGFIGIYKKAEVIKDFDDILQQMPDVDSEER